MKIVIADLNGGMGAVSKQSFIDDVITPLCMTYGWDPDAEEASLWYNVLKKNYSSTLAVAIERIIENRKTMPKPANVSEECRAVEMEKKCGSGGVIDRKVMYVCRDGRAVAMWKAIESTCKKSRKSVAWDNWLGICAPHKYENGVLYVFAPTCFVRDRLMNSPTERRLWQSALPEGTRFVASVFNDEK